jgi:uncharacterized membrane protein YgaE (UPF0421/DUF939 family)
MYKSIKGQERNVGRLILFILKMSAASGIAWELAKLAGSKHPYLAPLSVILCVQTTILQSVQYSVHRLLGTMIGVLLTAWVVDVLSLNGWTLAILIALVSAVALLLRRNESIIHEVALSVLLVFSLQKQSDHYGFDRIRDTLIGLAVGIALHILVYPPNMVKRSDKTISTLTVLLSQRFSKVADWLQNGCREEWKSALRAEEQAFQQELFQAEKKMEKATESMKMNIYAKRNRSLLQKNQTRLSLMKQGAAYLETAENIFSEWHANGTLSADELLRWAVLLRKIGAYWRNPVQIANEPSAPESIMPFKHNDTDPNRYLAAMNTATSSLVKQIYPTP